MRVIANSIPKAGTHLLKRCLQVMPDVQDTQVHLDWTLSLDQIESNLRSIPDRGFATAHLTPSPRINRFLEIGGYRMLLMIRDPRDVVISFVHYVRGEESHHLHDYFLQLNSFDRQLIAAIKGVSVDGEDRLLGIGDLFQSFLHWSSFEACSVVRFEDLIGPQGGGSLAMQTEAIRAIANHIDLLLEPEQIGRIASRTYDRHSPTFRKGLIGNWVNDFTEEAAQAMDEVAGDLLVRLGYEETGRLIAQSGPRMLRRTSPPAARESSGKTTLLGFDEIWASFRHQEQLQPRLLPVNLWRAWEQAALKHFSPHGTLLDVPGRAINFIRNCWPEIENIDILLHDRDDPGPQEALGGFRHLGSIGDRNSPTLDDAYSNIILYRALELVDSPGELIDETIRLMTPGGSAYVVVISDLLLEWDPVGFISHLTNRDTMARSMFEEIYLRVHGYRTLRSLDSWAGTFTKGGLILREFIPLLPELSARAFLLADQLWHLGFEGENVGKEVRSYLYGLDTYLEGIKSVLQGILALEPNPSRPLAGLFHFTKPVE